VRREEFGNVVSEERPSGGTEVPGVGGEIELAAHDTCPELGGAVPEIAEPLQIVLQGPPVPTRLSCLTLEHTGRRLA
jgi:hypothetical protein